MVIGVGMMPLPPLSWIFSASVAVVVGLHGVRRIFEHRHAAELGVLHDVVARHEVDQLGAELLGHRFRKLQFLVGLALVADQAAQAHAAGIGVLQNALGDVVGGIHRHHLAGHHDVDFLRLVLADRHREAAAHHVAEHVVGDVVDVLIGAVLLEEVDRGDDAAAGAADAGLRTAGLDALDVAVADLHHLFEFEVLDAAGVGGQAQDGVLRLGVQDQAGRSRPWDRSRRSGSCDPSRRAPPGCSARSSTCRCRPCRKTRFVVVQPFCSP